MQVTWTQSKSLITEGWVSRDKIFQQVFIILRFKIKTKKPSQQHFFFLTLSNSFKHTKGSLEIYPASPQSFGPQLCYARTNTLLSSIARTRYTLHPKQAAKTKQKAGLQLSVRGCSKLCKNTFLYLSSMFIWTRYTDICTDARNQLQRTETNHQNNYLAGGKDKSTLEYKQTFLLHLMFMSKTRPQCEAMLRTTQTPICQNHSGLGEPEKQQGVFPLLLGASLPEATPWCW